MTTDTSTPIDTTTTTVPDPRPIFTRAIETATAVIESIPADRPELYDVTSPCGMDVRELHGHLVMVLQRVACAGRGDDVWTWPGDVKGLADDKWAAAWREAAGAIDDAWADDSVLARDTTLPWATMPGADVLRMYTNELTVHSWDLAMATGQDPAWDQQVLETAYASITRELPMADRAPMWEAAKAEMPPEIPWSDPFANAVDVADDAPLIDRLVAWNGRQP